MPTKMQDAVDLIEGKVIEVRGCKVIPWEVVEWEIGRNVVEKIKGDPIRNKGPDAEHVYYWNVLDGILLVREEYDERLSAYLDTGATPLSFLGYMRHACAQQADCDAIDAEIEAAIRERPKAGE